MLLRDSTWLLLRAKFCSKDNAENIFQNRDPLLVIFLSGKPVHRQDRNITIALKISSAYNLERNLASENRVLSSTIYMVPMKVRDFNERFCVESQIFISDKNSESQRSIPYTFTKHAYGNNFIKLSYRFGVYIFDSCLFQQLVKFEDE